MTISDATHVTGAKPRHAAVQRQAPRPLALEMPAAIFTRRETPLRPRIGPSSARKTNARSRQLFPVTVPQPRNISRPNLLFP